MSLCSTISSVQFNVLYSMQSINVLSKIWCVCELSVHMNTLTFLFYCMQGDAKVEGEVSETVTLCFVSAGCKAG